MIIYFGNPVYPLFKNKGYVYIYSSLKIDKVLPISVDLKNDSITLKNSNLPWTKCFNPQTSCRYTGTPNHFWRISLFNNSVVVQFSLADLEATRDELLYEVHKMSTSEGGTRTDKTVCYMEYIFNLFPQVYFIENVYTAKNN